MKVVIRDNTILDCLAISSSLEYVKGVSRNCVTFSFNADDVSIDDLLKLFKSSTNAENITVIYDNNNTYEYVDYSIFNGISITDDIINVNMCQLASFEKEEQERVEQLNALSEVVADMLGGAL